MPAGRQASLSCRSVGITRRRRPPERNRTRSSPSLIASARLDVAPAAGERLEGEGDAGKSDAARYRDASIGKSLLACLAGGVLAKAWSNKTMLSQHLRQLSNGYSMTGNESWPSRMLPLPSMHRVCMRSCEICKTVGVFVGSGPRIALNIQRISIFQNRSLKGIAYCKIVRMLKRSLKIERMKGGIFVSC